MSIPPIYYINLSARTDRRASIETQLAALGLAATRIEAFTPAAIPTADLAAYGDPRRRFWMMPAELACSLSHGEALSRIAKGEDRYGVVFEDDVRLSGYLPQFLDLLQAGPSTYDLVRLETYLEPLRLSPRPVATLGKVQLRRAFSWAAGAAGYVVSRSAARRILDNVAFRQAQVDRALFNPYEPLARTITACHCDPGLCVQADVLDSTAAEGDIKAERMQRAAIERPLLWQRIPANTAEWIDRELRIGALKFWHQHVGGAGKHIIRFDA